MRSQSLIVYKSTKMPRSVVPHILTAKGTTAKLCALYSIASYRSGAIFVKTRKAKKEIRQVNAPGQWIGTIHSLRQALQLTNNTQVTDLLEILASNGYLTYSIENKLINYTLPWYNAEKRNRHYGTQYYEFDQKQPARQPQASNSKIAIATTDQGWFFLPKIPLMTPDGCYEEADAWMDLWTHTIYQDYYCAFSFLAPCVSFGKYHSAITLEQLSENWGWEKTKVWRFLEKHKEIFPHFRLPGSYGMLIFNAAYPDANTDLPTMDMILHIIATLRDFSGYKVTSHNDNTNLNRMIAAHSRDLLVEKGYLTQYKGKRYRSVSKKDIETEQNQEPDQKEADQSKENLLQTDRGVADCKNQNTFLDFSITFCVLANDEMERQKTIDNIGRCIFGEKSPPDNINIIFKPYELISPKDCDGGITSSSVKNFGCVLGGDEA